MEKLDFILVTIGLCLIGVTAIYMIISNKRSKKEPKSTEIGSSLTMEDPNSVTAHETSSLK